MAEKRLIDANALHKRIEMNLRASNPLTIEECCYKDALNSVDGAPTIDPETLRPVAHWEESTCLDDSFWACSNCQFPSEAIAAPVLYHYCPHCGARMEDAPDDDD